MRFRLVAFAVCLPALTVAVPARADEAQAEALFLQGHKALEAGEIEVACRRFTESQKQDPSAGTLLSLADCHHKEGKTSTAWAEFREAATLAGRDGRRNHLAEALRRAAELEPLLSYLTIKVEKSVPGLTVVRGDISIGDGAHGVRLPVDPGTWKIIASAPGYESWSGQVTIGREKDEQSITIPALEPKTSRSTPKPSRGKAAGTPEAKPRASDGAPKSTEPAPASARRTASLVIGGAGILLAGAGATSGVLALLNYDQAHEACPEHRDCSDGALELRSTAGRQATLANIGLGVGLAGVAIGAVLFVTSGPDSKPTGLISAGVTAHADHSSLDLRGRFW